MIFTQFRKQLRLGLALLVGGLASTVAPPVAAQTGTSAYAQDPGDALSRHLQTLAASPRNLAALMGAGEAALELGDAQAAATFYARAEEVAPRDGRVKAGLGSALLAMEQVQAALKFFEDARALGAPEGEFASDRGLAHDLLGNPAQAQRDYALAMRTNDTAEVRRRLALSKAISGDRAGALALIDEQLKRQDRSAWRVRAFVLALTGDAKGATEAVRAVMPGQAAAMEPFLARLPMLSPAGRAMAVHFGHFPADLGSLQVAQAPQQYTPPAAQSARPAATNTQQPQATRQQTRTSSVKPAPTSARRQSSSALTYAEERAVLRGSGTIGRRASQAAEARPQPAQAARAETSPPRPAQGPPSEAGQPVALAATMIARDVPAVVPPPEPAPAPRVVEVTPPPSVVSAEVIPAAGREPAVSVSGLASIAELIETLPDEAPASAEPPKPAAKLAKAETKPAAKKAAPAPAPARHWVQIASAPEAAAAAEYKRIQRKSPDLLGGTTGWKTANRVLVGPFKNRGEAQAMVNKLAKADIAAVPWTSPEGQEIVKLAAK